MNKTSIEWSDFTWNPIRARLVKDGRPHTGTANNGRQVHSGTFCTRVSPGCKNCYASVINKRLGTGLEYEVPNLAHHEFYIDERILKEPLRRKKPARIFVADMFDLFHEAIPDAMIGEVLRVCYKLQRHTFQILTKRAARMQTIVSEAWRQWQISIPPDHLWFGVSVEDQQRADERIPHLLQTPASMRFLSVEPMIEAINLDWAIGRTREQKIDWVICGGESGPSMRPLNPAWAESLLDQCRAARVPFFMKQDSGRFPGKQGRLSDDLWSMKQFPAPSQKAEVVPA